MGGSSKMELTHPVMVASSAGTLRRCVKHIAEGGRSERDLRDERGGPFDPGIAQELDVSRNTVRRYLKPPEAMRPKARPPGISTGVWEKGWRIAGCWIGRSVPWATRAATRRWCSMSPRGGSTNSPRRRCASGQGRESRPRSTGAACRTSARTGSAAASGCS